LSYRWVEHTGELEVEIEAPTERAVFEDGFEAMRELLGPGGADGGSAAPPREVSLNAPDRAALLADWLAELAFLGESEGLVPERLASLELGERALRAVVEGRRGRPPHLVKAATYHRLALERTGDGWRATVVLDV
jgi:SHS2 domain-containing protein